MKRKRLTPWQQQKLGVEEDPKAVFDALKRQATTLCRAAVMEDWGDRCAKCKHFDKPWNKLEWHHLIGTGHWAHKFNPKNGMALCHDHHKWATNRPSEFDDWLRDNHHCIWAWRNKHRRDVGKRTTAFLEEQIAILENL